MNLPASQIDNAIPVLLDILRDIPTMDFDPTLLWHSTYIHNVPGKVRIMSTRLEWALPDQLVSATVSSLLRLASSFPQYRPPVTSSILEFSSTIIEQLKSEHRECHDHSNVICLTKPWYYQLIS